MVVFPLVGYFFKTSKFPSRLIRYSLENENYIHSDVVRDLFGVQIEISDTMDVPREISALLQARNPTAYSPETVKRKLNKLGAPRMTMELLHSRDPADEVIGWLRDISKFIQA